MKVGVIAGSVLPADVLIGGPPMTEFGPASSPIHEIRVEGGSLLIIARHGTPARIPPHKVNHMANVLALAQAGSGCLVSICSSGALHRVSVPSIAVVSDYFDLWSGATLFDTGIQHATPGLDPALRARLLDALRRAGVDPVDGGIYVQTRGPRLETRAEIAFLSTVGDYVGMNMGSEATIACELGIPFAGIVTVDNLAHGVGGARPEFEDILGAARSNWDILFKALSYLPALFEGEGRSP